MQYNKTVLWVFVSLFIQGCCNNTYKESNPSEKSLISYPIRYIIQEHKQSASKIDGSICPFEPSCSSFGLYMVEKHGFLGLLLTIDRLFYRESGNYQKKYMLKKIQGNSFIFHDPTSDYESLFCPKHSSLYGEDYINVQ